MPREVSDVHAHAHELAGDVEASLAGLALEQVDDLAADAHHRFACALHELAALRDRHRRPDGLCGPGARDRVGDGLWIVDRQLGDHVAAGGIVHREAGQGRRECAGGHELLLHPVEHVVDEPAAAGHVEPDRQRHAGQAAVRSEVAPYHRQVDEAGGQRPDGDREDDVREEIHVVDRAPDARAAEVLRAEHRPARHVGDEEETGAGRRGQHGRSMARHVPLGANEVPAHEQRDAGRHDERRRHECHALESHGTGLAQSGARAEADRQDART